MQVPLLRGIYVDSSPDIRTSYPRNLVPVPKPTGVAQGYLRASEGIVGNGVGPGPDRGGHNWNGFCYRVMGSKLVRVLSDGTVTTLGDVGLGSPVTIDHSFDRLSIASAGKLWYWDGATLSFVTDPDIGVVVDQQFIAGYYMTTDGTSLIVTDLTDPTSVNPLKYGSAESDPDPIVAVAQLHGEAIAIGRLTFQFFQNVGGLLFPFQFIEGSLIERGAIGTHTWCYFAETIAFMGSGKNEAPGIYLAGSGSSSSLSTREIDRILLDYTEAELSQCVMETQVDKAHNRLLIHLPDRCLVYDAAATVLLEEPVWYEFCTALDGLGQYLGRSLVWCYDKWLVGDPAGGNVGFMSDTLTTHYGQQVGYSFGTVCMYNAGNAAIIHQIELVALTGTAPLGAPATIWTSYSIDGVTFSQEKPVNAGAQGQRDKRLVWFHQGFLRNFRVQKFRGVLDAPKSFLRLEMAVEALNG